MKIQTLTNLKTLLFLDKHLEFRCCENTKEFLLLKLQMSISSWIMLGFFSEKNWARLLPEYFTLQHSPVPPSSTNCWNFTFWNAKILHYLNVNMSQILHILIRSYRNALLNPYLGMGIFADLETFHVIFKIEKFGLRKGGKSPGLVFCWALSFLHQPLSSVNLSDTS